MSSKIDSYATEIIEELKAQGMYENTTILYVSDHGGISRTHCGKSMREMQVPFAISGKGVKPSYKIEGSTMVFDIAATVLDVFNIPKPQAWIGRSIDEIYQ